jgi:hypothetical protein
MEWKTLLASSTGTVAQELLLRNEYLAMKNRLLCHLTGHTAKPPTETLSRQEGDYGPALREERAP